MPVWDPQQYARFSTQRSRPYLELVGRIPAEAPARVVDLGCGDGELTETLTQRWPQAQIEGIDSSSDMLQAARPRAGLTFRAGDIKTWQPDRPVDVIISNAALQWVDGHLDLLGRFVESLTPGGFLAFQVPGNFGEPSHTLLTELRRSPRWRDKLGNSAQRLGSHEPDEYLDRLARLGCAVDVWETTYQQVLTGPDPVLEWVKGTALRPVLELLDPAETKEFLSEYGAALRTAYPSHDYGTIFPFRRIFAVAQKGS